MTDYSVLAGSLGTPRPKAACEPIPRADLVATPALAGASFVAFMLAELADLAVYTPLKRSGRWNAAVWISGFVGAVADSLIFLWLAFGSAAVTASSVSGQVLGKMWAVGAVWLIVRWMRR